MAHFWAANWDGGLQNICLQIILLQGDLLYCEMAYLNGERCSVSEYSLLTSVWSFLVRPSASILYWLYNTDCSWVCSKSFRRYQSFLPLRLCCVKKIKKGSLTCITVLHMTPFSKDQHFDEVDKMCFFPHIAWQLSMSFTVSVWW